MKKQLRLKDCGVEFNAEEHTYTLKGKRLQGITSTLLPAVFGDLYANVPKDTLDAAAERGKEIHEMIELIDDLSIAQSNRREVQEYIRLRDATGLVPRKSEYIVTDRSESLASPIDKVYEDDIIAEIKTTAELHYEQALFQLSWYACMYSRINKRKVKNAYIFHLPKEQYGRCTVYEVQLISPKRMSQITQDYLDGADVSVYKELFRQRAPKRVMVLALRILQLEQKKKKLEQSMNDAKNELMGIMAERDLKKFSNEYVHISLVTEGTRTIFDTAKIKSEYPTIYAQCTITSATKPSLRVTAAKEKSLQ